MQLQMIYSLNFQCNVPLTRGSLATAELLVHRSRGGWSCRLS